MVFIKESMNKVGKIYWKISEVAEMLKTSTPNIRFWESKFEWLKPKKGKKGHRQYIKEDLQNFIDVHILIRNGMTAKGIVKAYEKDYFDKLVEFFKNEEIKERNRIIKKEGLALPLTKEESYE